MARFATIVRGVVQQINDAPGTLQTFVRKGSPSSSTSFTEVAFSGSAETTRDETPANAERTALLLSIRTYVSGSSGNTLYSALDSHEAALRSLVGFVPREADNLRFLSTQGAETIQTKRELTGIETTLEITLNIISSER